MATPDQLVADARGYAGDIKAEAVSAMAAVSAQIAAGGIWQGYIPQWQDTAPITKVTLDDPPVLDAISLTLPAEPSTSAPYQDISAIEVGLIPEFNLTAPTFVEPTKPNQVADFTETAPTIVTSFDFPDAPDELQHPNFTLPVMADHSAPERPEYSVPEFTAQTPQLTTAEPVDLDTTTWAAYREASGEFLTVVNGYVDDQLTKLNPQYHTQMAAIEAQLTLYLQGGTGLRPEVEDAIYSRARGKNDAEARRVRDQALNEAAARGFTLPTGALMSAIQQARQAGADNNARAANEIVVMQAEMEQKNLQFAVSTSAALRNTMVQATLGYMQSLVQLNGQALDCAKMILSAVIETYNLSLKLFDARVNVFKSEVALYETKLKIVTIKLDIYRGELAAMESLLNVDRLKVDIYKAEIDSLMSLANMYKTQIDAVTSRASLEKLKLELFQTQVQNYAALVSAKNAEWQGFSAQINGQQAQAGLYSAQVSGYSAAIQGIKTKIEAQSEVVKAQIATNQAAADQVKTAAALFQSIVQARGNEANVKLDVEKLKLSNYSEELRAKMSKAQLELDYYKAQNDAALDLIGKRVQSDAQTGDLITSRMKALADVGTASGQILGNLAGSAMSGMNSLVAMTETI